MLPSLSRIPDIFFTAKGEGLSLIGYAFLFSVCMAFFTPGFGTIPPTDRDESLFAQASKQILETNDWIDIHFQDTPRYKKPIGIYWLQAISVTLLNPSHRTEIWAYRIPSLLGLTLAVLLTAELGCLLFTPLIGLTAGILLAGCALTAFEARLAKTDACLLAFCVLSQSILARAYLHRLRHSYHFILFWVALGLGFLIKGPIILLILTSTLLYLWFYQKSLSWFMRLRPHLGIPIFLALTLPWFLTISYASHGLFLQESAHHDLLQKIWQGNHGYLPPGLYCLLFPLLFFPSSLFAYLALTDTIACRRDPKVAFLLAWIIPAWIVFELLMTKLPHYILPTLPAIALLSAKALCEGYPQHSKRMASLKQALFIGLWLSLGVGLSLFFLILSQQTSGQRVDWPLATASLILLLAQAFCLFCLIKRKLTALSILVIGSMIFSAELFGVSLPHLQNFWIARDAVAEIQTHMPCSNPQILSTYYHEPSLIFLGGTDVELIHDTRETARQLAAQPCRVALIEHHHVMEFEDTIQSMAPKPILMSTIKGYNLGHGKMNEFSIYRMPYPTSSP